MCVNDLSENLRVFTHLLYLSDELYLQDLIPGVEQTDDEAFKFLPVGAKFVRADKTKSSGSTQNKNLNFLFQT